MSLWDMVVARKAPEYYRRQNQLADQAEYRGLLEKYDSRRYEDPDPVLMQAGPVQVAPLPPERQGLLDRTTREQFLMRASAIPGYEGLAGGFLNNEGGLQRQQMQGDQQMQQQRYLNENMSQQQRHALQQQQPLVDAQTAQAYAAGGASDARAASSYASAAHTNQSMGFDREARGEAGLLAALNIRQKRDELGANQRAMNGGLGFGDLNAADQQKARLALGNSDQWASGALDVADWASDRNWGSGDAAVRAQQWEASVKPAFMQILNTGALEGSEAEKLMELIGQPGTNWMTEANRKKIQSAAQMVADTRENLYRSYGLRATPLTLGQSASSRTLSDKAQGKLTPYTGQGQWQKVQRDGQ